MIKINCEQFYKMKKFRCQNCVICGVMLRNSQLPPLPTPQPPNPPSERGGICLYMEHNVIKLKLMQSNLKSLNFIV